MPGFVGENCGQPAFAPVAPVCLWESLSLVIGYSSISSKDHGEEAPSWITSKTSTQERSLSSGDLVFESGYLDKLVASGPLNYSTICIV